MSILTANSISGGKTSCYMAIHYPSDINVFACVLTNDKSCLPSDKGLLREIQNKLPQFEGSKELDQTLINVLKLEQKIGKSIKWVSSDLTYDELIEKRKYLPNKRSRICTYELKILPIFQYLYYHYNAVIMNIGYRVDEINRAKKMMVDCNKAYNLKVPVSCRLSGSKRQSHKVVEWRYPVFPLIENNITHETIVKYWKDQNWVFPSVSNCDFCFNHTPQQLREQKELFPNRFQWWEDQETKLNKTFGSKSINQVISDYSKGNNVIPAFNCACTD
jgi:hypothetical protein